MQNHVPLAVISDILLYLSVKSLCRYKCVSKHWCSLISDPRFVKRHINLATVDKDVECQRRKLVILALKEETENKQGKRFRYPISFYYSMYHAECEAMSMSSNDSMAVKIDFPFLTGENNRVKFIGSFNGLLCLLSYSSNNFILFNPATNELKSIENLHDRFGLCGFGYDHSIDDYNVVQVICKSDVYVYSLRTDTWRAAQNFPYKDCIVPRFTSDRAVPLNGAVHWVFDRDYDFFLKMRLPSVIVAFDLAEGKFRELPQPIDAPTNGIGVAVLGGCICWLTYSERISFWVMKEYGVKESWTRVFVLREPFLSMKPLSYLKNDDVLLEIDGLLIIYSKKLLKAKVVLIRDIDGRLLDARKYVGRLEAETYVESLVSPNAWK